MKKRRFSSNLASIVILFKVETLKIIEIKISDTCFMEQAIKNDICKRYETIDFSTSHESR